MAPGDSVSRPVSRHLGNPMRPIRGRLLARAPIMAVPRTHRPAWSTLAHFRCAGESESGLIVQRCHRPSWSVPPPAACSAGEHFVASSHSVARSIPPRPANRAQGHSRPTPGPRSVRDCPLDSPSCFVDLAHFRSAGEFGFGLIVPRSHRPSWCVSSPAPSSSGEHFVASSHSAVRSIPPRPANRTQGHSRPTPGPGCRLRPPHFSTPSVLGRAARPSRLRSSAELAPVQVSAQLRAARLVIPTRLRSSVRISSRSLRDRIRGPAVSPTVTVLAVGAEHLNSTCHRWCVPRRRSFPPWR